MNLHFIELLKILQLIIIRNNSEGKSIKTALIAKVSSHEQYKRLVKCIKIDFLYSTLKSSTHVVLFSALECTKNNTLRPLAQKRFALPNYKIVYSGLI